MFEGLPSALMPVVGVVVATLVGAVLWRLFKLALKLVFLVVAVLVLASVIVWKRPDLAGAADSALGATSAAAGPASAP
ncbi:MAG: hypothetical protein FJ137_14075 [Deltaproteobacteria bacterium]|nr:hypothetical protein [Deltaproteobacteria bacterium]